MVTSPELILDCSLDPLVDVISAESQVRGGDGLPAARVEWRRVGGVIDKDLVVFILSCLYFFSSLVKVVVSPTLGPAVKVASDEEAAVWDMDGI